MASFPFIGQLLAKAIIKRASSMSIPAAIDDAARQHTRSAYILKVLQASSGTRAIVKNLARQSDSVGQKQLFCILTVFDFLDQGRKADFIVAFKASATLHTQATNQVSLGHAYQGGHVPPYYQP